jgi:hypothetical protein
MITLQDCIALCGLSEAEVLAIAEHEHVPEVVAAALAEELLKQAHGAEKIRHMIVEDIRAASARGDTHHVHELLHCLKCFLETHPEAVPATVRPVARPQS